MPTPLRPSKSNGYEYITLMVPSAFRESLVKQAKSEGRSLSDVARRRLMGSQAQVSRYEWEPQQQSNGWAHSVFRVEVKEVRQRFAKCDTSEDAKNLCEILNREKEQADANAREYIRISKAD